MPSNSRLRSCSNLVFKSSDGQTLVSGLRFFIFSPSLSVSLYFKDGLIDGIVNFSDGVRENWKNGNFITSDHSG